MNINVGRRFLCLAISSGLGLACTAIEPALADTLTGSIYDNTSYSQTSNSAPAAPFGYFFSIGGFFSTPGSFTTATATYPGPGSQVLPLVSPTQFNFNSGFYSSLSNLHAAYPFGTYSITAGGGSAGTQTSNIPYTADYFTSGVPYITNFSSLNGLNPAANFQVNYNAFTPNPSVTEGFTFFTVYKSGVQVYGNEFQSPSSTDSIIAAGTLLPNTAYTYELDYSDRLNGSDSPNGTFTEQGFDVRTDGSFTTGSTVTPLPTALPLFATSLGGLGLLGWRRKRKNAAAR